MIRRLFNFWKRSKEEKAAKLASNLIRVLDNFDRSKATYSDCSAINIYEFKSDSFKYELTDGYRGKFSIRFDKNGKIIKQ